MSATDQDEPRLFGWGFESAPTPEEHAAVMAAVTDPWTLIQAAAHEGRNVDPDLTDDEASAVERFAHRLLQLAARALPPAAAPAMAPMHSAPTSQRMREAALPRSGSLRAEMVDLLLANGAGKTDDQMEEALGRSHQSVSAARHTLVGQGWIQAMTREGCLVERATRSGNAAQVWCLTPAARIRLSIERERASRR